MTRLNMILVLALLASSLYLVRTAYDSRRLFAELDKAKNEPRGSISNPSAWRPSARRRPPACASSARRARNWPCARPRRP